jgi:Fic family protein
MEHLLPHMTSLPRGKYLHWDKLRRMAAPEGLSAEEWWAAVSMSRSSLFQPLRLLDKQGKPFVFATPAPVSIDLHHIDRDAAGQIRGAGGALQSDSHRFLISSLIEEAITSSQLEGAATTRKVAVAMLRSGRKPRDLGEKMIFNNYRAMEHLRSLRNEKLTPEHVLELHRMLSEDTLDDPGDAGRYRRNDDVHIVDVRDNTALHIPPTHTELPERMQRLCEFANAEETPSQPFIHPVVRAILLHFMIGYDHPFADGNGRTARALFYWSMARSGYWLMEYTSISHILRKAPAQYMRAYLYTETDKNDTTYFLIHQLQTIRQAIAALHEYVDRKVREQRETGQLLASSPALRGQFNHRQLALLDHALRNAGEAYRVDAHQRSHAVVYQTARNDLLVLETLGLLEKTRQGNAYIFYAPTDLRERLSKLAE